jgi:hypothetical protein
MNANSNPKRKSKKFTGSAKVTLAALTVTGFVGGWNYIGRLEAQEKQADPPSPPQPVVWPNSTPLPAIPALSGIAPIPTLASHTVKVVVNSASTTSSTETNRAMPAPLPEIAPLPTLAPLPPMPQPPPPPPAPVWNNSSQSNQSGGS